MSQEAQVVFDRLSSQYRAALEKNPHARPGFAPASRSENVPFREMENLGLIEQVTFNHWQFTAVGVRKALS